MGSPKAQRRQKGLVVPSEHVDERTPLRISYHSSPYVEGDGVQEEAVFDEDPDNDRLSQEVDDAFGKFPGRLLNHHVSSSTFLAPDGPLIVMVVSGGTGSLNQSYVAIVYAVIMPPTWNSGIISMSSYSSRYLLAVLPHMHSIFLVHDN
jgi:glucose/arabinose dehydrogenase